MNPNVKPAKHSASGQYLGFALQPVRAFYYLLTCPKGAKVSLEFQDDVAIHHPDGTLCLEQTKSALRQNPISDWATDLWKAFHNWLTMLEAGDCEPGGTRFRIYVTPAKTGAFAAALASASTAEDVTAVLETIRTKFARRKSPPACTPHLEPFLESPVHHQVAIVTRFELEATASDPLEAIRTLLLPTIPEEYVDILAKSGIGQASQAFDRLIRRGKTPILDAEEFRRDFRAFVRQNNLPGLLISLSGVPSDEMLGEIASTQPTFIRQLELVEVNDEDRLRAISDFLRTSADKSDWAERGLVFPGSLDVWDDDLVRRHGMVCGEISDLHGDKPEAVRGRLIYRICAKHQTPLEGRVVPGHFVHGSYNHLADRRRIGWHPNYLTLLSGDKG